MSDLEDQTVAFGCVRPTSAPGQPPPCELQELYFDKKSLSCQNSSATHATTNKSELSCSASQDSDSCSPCSCSSTCDDTCPGGANYEPQNPDEFISRSTTDSNAELSPCCEDDGGEGGDSDKSTNPDDFMTCEVFNLPGSSSSSGEKINITLCKAAEDPKAPCELVTLQMHKETCHLIENPSDPNLVQEEVEVELESEDPDDPANYVTFGKPPYEEEEQATGTQGTCTDDTLKTCSCVETCEVDYDAPMAIFDYTLAIIKPEAMIYRRQIEKMICTAGFTVRQMRWLKLSPEQASDFYQDKFKREDYGRKVMHLSSAPVLVLILSKKDAVREWKLLMGPSKVSDAKVIAPDSIRGRYGRPGDDIKNTVHGSADPEAAKREIHFFFPDCVLEPLPHPCDCLDYLWATLNKILTKGLIRVCEEKPDDPVVWLGNWLLDHNTSGPKCLLSVE